jgi:hypothetical protein
MSLQTFHRTPHGRVWETTVCAQLELETLKFIDLAAQEYDRDEFLPQFTHKTLKQNRNSMSQAGTPWLMLPVRTAGIEDSERNT